MGEKAQGTAHIKIPDLMMTDYVSAASSIWSLNHNLNAIGLIIQCYNNNDELIIPTSIYLDDPNNCTVTWSEAVSGYALFDYIERVWTFDSIMETVIPDGTWKIGTGGSLNYNPIISNNIQTPALSGTFENTSSDSNYYYLEITVPETDNDYNFTEIGIFNSSNNIMFYSAMSSLYKPSNMALNIHYRIEKSLG